jgi:CRP-like cAMP-binding protein
MQRPTDEQLATVPLFSRMSPEDRAQVAQVAEVLHYRTGDLVFKQGEPSNVLLSLLSGRVRIIPSDDKPADLPEVIDPGDPIGDVAAFEGGPFPASGMAAEPTECMVIMRAEFFRLLEENPTLVRGLVHGLTDRLVRLTRELRKLRHP